MTQHPSTRRLSTRPSRAVAVGLASLLLLSACGSDSDSGSGAVRLELAAEGEADFSYLIPAGAGQALDAGTPLEILPAELDAEVGEIIEIVNEDDRGHTVGPFFVGAHETLRQRFSSPGQYIGVCTVHPSGQIVLTVSS
ncbi:MAG: hypothetical protein GY929_13255 [Actinomycetia bacterium]|nr:hypothetical protein [Actinomycetes bacterium]